MENIFKLKRTPVPVLKMIYYMNCRSEPTILAYKNKRRKGLFPLKIGLLQAFLNQCLI